MEMKVNDQTNFDRAPEEWDYNPDEYNQKKSLSTDTAEYNATSQLMFVTKGYRATHNEN